MPPWTLVAPASRGIGLALARRILQTTNAPVVATARRDLDHTRERVLSGLDGVDESRLTVLQLDVLDEATISAAASHCAKAFPSQQNNHLHLAFLIPGILHPEKSPAQVDAEKALLTLRTNTLGPLLLLKHFAPFLPTKRTELSGSGGPSPPDDTGNTNPKNAASLNGLSAAHATVALMSARVGSISDNSLGGWYTYRASKAAVNQLVKTFDNHLKTQSGERAMAVGLHPGSVKTALSKDFWASTKKEKLFEPAWVAERLVGLCTVGGGGVDAVGIHGRGRCWDWDGKEVPP